jgi:hypothetical protein
MAGPGSGPQVPGPTVLARSPPDPGVPRAVLRSWDEAEARLFPTIMARPDVYQQAVSLIQQLLGRLRETCPDLPSLLAAHERGGDLVDELAEGADAGIQPGLVAAAACAMRYRELVASLAAQGRLAALTRARDQGESWAVVAETGRRIARPSSRTSGSRPNPAPDGRSSSRSSRAHQRRVHASLAVRAPGRG